MIIKKLVNAIVSILIAVLLVLALTLVANRFVFKQDDLFGYQIYYVSTGSMEPAINTGDLILSKAVEFDQLEEGDVITFISQQGETKGLRITHRIISIDAETKLITTKGDANSINDVERVSFDNVLGEYQMTLTLLGFIYRIFITPWGLVLFIAPLLVAVVVEIINLIKTLGKEEEPEGEQEENLEEKYQKQLIEQYAKEKEKDE